MVTATTVQQSDLYKKRREKDCRDNMTSPSHSYAHLLLKEKRLHDLGLRLPHLLQARKNWKKREREREKLGRKVYRAAMKFRPPRPNHPPKFMNPSQSQYRHLRMRPKGRAGKLWNANCFDVFIMGWDYAHSIAYGDDLGIRVLV
ncbi:unnamed protein product [Periconia digitata]|uniref:Uncharacterized protein n=1 Tax=Periconia digitata TaxID=1303443 RepID=A0A9W4XUZ3_9PLEO|nr:unnamed protein product [Periconia digitata]